MTDRSRNPTPEESTMTEHTPEHLVVDRRDAVTIVTLSRPERLNAFTHEMLTDLRTLLTDLDTDAAVRAIVITGAGRAFSAGADLGIGATDAEDSVRRLYNPLIQAVTTLDTPVVAAVNGIAAGAGFSLALACDLRIASPAAAFQLSFARIGLVPDAGATWLLPRAVGSTRAVEIAMLGRKVSADDALRWNLAAEVAAELATTSSSAGATKALLRDAHARTLDEQLDAEATAQGIAQHSPAFIAARAAFREKAARKSR
jgi:2-(1,2-epoxy-1,2-dihydrophenyl)acetyl-CoA isomerase